MARPTIIDVANMTADTADETEDDGPALYRKSRAKMAKEAAVEKPEQEETQTNRVARQRRLGAQKDQQFYNQNVPSGAGKGKPIGREEYAPSPTNFNVWGRRT